MSQGTTMQAGGCSMRDYHLPFGRYVLRVLHRPNWLRPYFSSKYMPGCFGFGYWGVMLMQTMSREELATFKRCQGEAEPK